MTYFEKSRNICPIFDFLPNIRPFYDFGRCGSDGSGIIAEGNAAAFIFLSKYDIPLFPY
jgi:hypothetical protein